MPLVITSVRVVPARPGTVCALCGDADPSEIEVGTDCLEVTCSGPFGEQSYYVRLEHREQHALPEPEV